MPADTPKLTVVIPTRKGGRRLGDLLVSILRQQSPPPFEVLVVANTFDAGVEEMVQGLGSRFRYLRADKSGVNIARNLGLHAARGEVTLFLDDDTFLEEPLLLKRHFDLHQKRPGAIGIGGRYALKRRATSIERAYHWILDHQLSALKIDSDRTLHLVGGNASYKTLPLRLAFRFNEDIVFGGADLDLNARLHMAGHELILSERLGVEHRVDMTTWSLLQKGFLQGLAREMRIRDRLTSHWRFQGARQTRLGNLEEAGVPLDFGMRFSFALYDLAFRAGQAWGERAQTTTHAVSAGRILLELLRETLHGARRMPLTWTLELERTLLISRSDCPATARSPDRLPHP